VERSLKSSLSCLRTVTGPARRPPEAWLTSIVWDRSIPYLLWPAMLWDGAGKQLRVKPCLVYPVCQVRRAGYPGELAILSQHHLSVLCFGQEPAKCTATMDQVC